MPSLEEKVEHLLIEVQDLRDRIADLERTRNRARTAVIGPGRFPLDRNKPLDLVDAIDPSLRKMLDDYAKKHNIP